MNQAQTKQSKQAVAESNKRKLAWGLACLVVPTALIALVILIMPAVDPDVSSDFLNNVNRKECEADAASSSPQLTKYFTVDECASNPMTDIRYQERRDYRIATDILGSVGIIAIVAWLPGIVAGVILLKKRT